jgi:hypothetical protein
MAEESNRRHWARFRTGCPDQLQHQTDSVGVYSMGLGYPKWKSAFTTDIAGRPNSHGCTMIDSGRDTRAVPPDRVSFAVSRACGSDGEGEPELKQVDVKSISGSVPLLVMFAVSDVAQSQIARTQNNSTAIFNNYTNIFPGMPNYGIAQGSIFELFGAGLAMTTNAQQSFPLSTSLSGTSVSISINSVTTQAILYYVSPGQINGIIPSADAGRNGADHGDRKWQAERSGADYSGAERLRHVVAERRGQRSGRGVRCKLELSGMDECGQPWRFHHAVGYRPGAGDGAI